MIFIWKWLNVKINFHLNGIFVEGQIKSEKNLSKGPTILNKADLWALNCKIEPFLKNQN